METNGTSCDKRSRLVRKRRLSRPGLSEVGEVGEIAKMFKAWVPHLPDQVYDVQAEVKPIHKPALIWSAVIPM
jgi:hypothetical protein